MRTFVIQSKTAWSGHSIPAQSYGYTAIEAIEYQNWRQREKVYDYVLNNDMGFTSHGKAGAPEAIEYDYLSKNHIPVGSAEYTLAWLSLMGCGEVRPLNIPKEMRSYLSRECVTTSELSGYTGEWMVKDAIVIKSDSNGFMKLPREVHGNYFMTQWIDDVISEWRLFVFNKEIVGMRCYSGNEWVTPDKAYCERVVSSYSKKTYTLDVMVYPNRNKPMESNIHNDWMHRLLITDIVEVHDFFACGLYGFEDYKNLPRMWSAAIDDLLGRGEKGVPQLCR